MKVLKWTMFVVLVAGLVAVPFAQEKGGGDETGPYEVVPNWPQPLHPDWTWGRTPGVWAESPNKVYVLQSAELPKLDNPIGVGGVPVRDANGQVGRGATGAEGRDTAGL